ncbi:MULTISPECIES: (2Fe-2S)-binding protein [unclassified Rhodanobacter]|jgi:D-hydroxyproline dehydrogenase subunit gamma|uniref:(2Fe-2S)-binding protein n=1 Tax=unclassified Rhodanobacter TaxID=2621553 RepID=UPI00161E2E96|nr:MULTISPECIES: (2Fe-2S)-binding protein [unclassified Rhodanobacter]MBB6244340.1 sarcosine oxidase subunit alpha [Rhodanobacter sp. MP1X3]MBB6248349.1 sarcosine oxidase subunit alpha [Rhodanobacter sp. A1T4]
MNAPLIRLQINGCTVEARAGTSVAAAIAQHSLIFRRSTTGQPRAAFCGMGVCFECRVAIDGIGQRRACMVPVREGMQVSCDD